jgi:dipeptidase
VENVTLKEAASGFYERSISLFRTSYSTVTQSREALPPVVGARVWACQYMPAMSTYIPLYVSNPELPEAYTTGSLFRVGGWALRGLIGGVKGRFW